VLLPFKEDAEARAPKEDGARRLLEILGCTFMQKGDHQSAKDVFENRLQAMLLAEGITALELAWSYNDLAKACNALDLPETIDHARSAVKYRRLAHGQQHGKVGIALRWLYGRLHDYGRTEEAIETAMQSARILKDTNCSTYIFVCYDLFCIHEKIGDVEAAREWRQNALGVKEGLLVADIELNRALARSCIWIADILMKGRVFEEATVYYHRFYQIALAIGRIDYEERALKALIVACGEHGEVEKAGKYKELLAALLSGQSQLS
jgi:tetratricopeptide (TPR) repeat protein